MNDYQMVQLVAFKHYYLMKMYVLVIIDRLVATRNF
jgi:hypothetical protein